MIAPAARRIGVGDIRLSDTAKANVLDAMSRNRLTYGHWQRSFEERFAYIHNRRFACFVNSGTDALRLGLLAMKEKHGWPDGSLVAIPAVTFVATLNAVLQAGLRPLLVDIELEHFGMEPDRLRPGVAAAVPVHLFGHVAEPTQTRLTEIGLPILADSCETMFMDGCAAGEVSCFSTYSAHLITTGVGGLTTTDDPGLARIIRSLANHGRSGIYTSIDQGLGQREVMEARFHFEREGYSSRGTELQAAIGCAELDVWPLNVIRRQNNARRLRSGLSGLPLVLPQYDIGDSAWMMFPMLAESKEAREMLVTYLELNGIETRPLMPLTSQPFVRKLYPAWDMDAMFPNARRVNETGLYVGCHQFLESADIDYMVSVFRGCYG